MSSKDEHWSGRHFISCDWGTSYLRVRLVDLAGCVVLGEHSSRDGAGELAGKGADFRRPGIYRAALLSALGELGRQFPEVASECPVIISGMASSSIGWRELPYAKLPFPVDGRELVWEDLGPLEPGKEMRRVMLVSGLRGDLEVMRGEEVQVLGLMRLKQASCVSGEALLVLPGTHSKHVRVSGGSIVEFATFMTGEVFEALSEHTVLRHSVPQAPDGSEPLRSGTGPGSGAVRAAFLEGVAKAKAGPLLESLFHVRTRQLLRGEKPAESRALLSGLLVGSELGPLLDRWPGTAPIFLCGAKDLNDIYALGLDALGAGGRLRIVAEEDVRRLSALGQALLLNR
jgi:2-dehydro-3-deoxygalactonokinase